MALLYIDSFDHYATADLAEKWTSTTVSGGTLSIGSSGRRGSQGLRVTGPVSVSQCLATQTLAPVDASTCLAGFSLLLSHAPPTGGYAIFRVADGGTTQWTLAVLGDFRLQIRQGGVAGTVLATSSATGLATGVAAYLEVKGVIHPSAGTADIRVNGVSVLAATGLNTRSSANNAWTAVQLGVSTTTGSNLETLETVDYDDLYVLDGSGAAPWNAFLGDCRVDARYPTAEGATIGWTPSTGTDNAATLDETAPNDDTDYNTAAVTSLTDTFVCQDAPVAGAAIYGVQVNLSAKKTESGTCSLASVIRQGTTDLAGPAQDPTTSYAYLRTVYPTNPHTSAAWTESDFNANEYGYTRTA